MIFLISVTTALVLFVSLLCFMLVSNYERHKRFIFQDDPMSVEPMIDDNRIHQKAWNPSHGVLSDDDYMAAGKALIQSKDARAITKGDLSEHIYKNAEAACIEADNAIFRSMRNQGNLCSQ
jgi:hypothetical protein